MIRIFQAGWLILGLAWAQWAMADPSLKDLAARTEVRAIETLTLTDQQFLIGDKNGKTVMIAGQLRFPQGAPGRLPVVILQHGSAAPPAATSFGQKLSTKWRLRHSWSTASQGAGSSGRPEIRRCSADST